MKQKLLLGVDGGATKTAMVLADQDLNILAEVKTGPSNPHSLSAAKIQKNFKDGFKKLLKEAKLPTSTKLDAAVFGVAGHDSEKDHKGLVKIIKSAFKGGLPTGKKMRVVSDAVIGYWSGSICSTGVAILAGTGSNCYGRNAKGEEAWSSGVGHRMADQGAGYDIGIKILKAVVKAEDGRGLKTTLTKHIFKHFGVKNHRELIPYVYADDFGKKDVAALAYYLELAELEGDNVAKQIARECVIELVSMVDAVVKKLGLGRKDFDLVTIGSIVNVDPYIHKHFRREIKKKYKSVNFIEPEVKPVDGALVMAQKVLRKEL